LRIGDMAKATGKSVAALRYYEQIGPLLPARRTESGYRDYSLEVVERVRFILQAKETGFTLREIARILTLSDRGQIPCGRVAQAARRKIDQIDRRIAQLKGRRSTLARAVDRWESGLLDDSPYCSILSASEESERSDPEMARTIEVYSAGCSLCDDTLQHVREAVAPCGCTVIERSPDGPEASSYGISSVPTIVAEGQVVFVGRPTREQAVALLRR